MELFKKKADPIPAAPASQADELALLEKEREFGRYLSDQVQEQASAMLALGEGVAAQPSDRMVAAMAASWLVQHLGWSSALVFGVNDGSVSAYAAYPAKEADKASSQLVQSGVIGEFVKKRKAVTAPELQAGQGEGEAYGLPLQGGDALHGYLVLTGPQGLLARAESEAGDIARALSLAAMMARLAEQTRKLQELDAIRNSFVSTTSHQLRTPLSVVKWMFSVFLTDPELNKMESQMQMIKQAYAGVERIIDVVNDLLNVSRIQDGRLPYTPQKADPNPVLASVADDVKPILESRKLALELDVPERLGEFEFDAILLKEALQNLVNNAVDYNAEGGSVRIAAKEDEGWFTVTVSNTGAGIKPEDQGRMFTPLYRSADAVLLHPDGSGLGLYLTKAIADAHGGTVSFESNPGKLTTFTLRIPLARKG